MNILVLGAKGFVGKNLVAQLYNIKDNRARWYSLPEQIEAVYEYDVDSGKEILDQYCKDCTYVINVIEANYPRPDEQYKTACIHTTIDLVEMLKKHNNNCPVVTGCVSRLKELSEAELILKQSSNVTGARLVCYRFNEMFGKWCEPNTFSEVCTEIYNVANSRPVQTCNTSTILELNFIDDVIDELIESLSGREHTTDGFAFVPNSYRYTLWEIVVHLLNFDRERTALKVPRVSDSFIKALYSTYLSYLPDEKVSYDLDMKTDNRGSFTEFLRTNNHGQVSVNVSKPGMVKGQHWHNNRVEKFLVVSGHGLLQQRKIGMDKNGQPYPVLDSYVSSDKMEVIEVRPGFAHNLINLSETENLVTIIWGNDQLTPTMLTPILKLYSHDIGAGLPHVTHNLTTKELVSGSNNKFKYHVKR